jgi:hypothetical protein
MTKNTSVFAEDKLTEEQKDRAKQGICPFCEKAMMHLDRIPAKAEMYCDPCHFSMPLFVR